MLYSSSKELKGMLSFPFYLCSFKYFRLSLPIAMTTGFGKLSSPVSGFWILFNCYIQWQRHINIVTILYSTWMNTAWLHDIFCFFWTLSRGVHMFRDFHAYEVRGSEELLFYRFSSLILLGLLLTSRTKFAFLSEHLTAWYSYIWQNYTVNAIKAHTEDRSFSLRRAMKRNGVPPQGIASEIACENREFKLH